MIPIRTQVEWADEAIARVRAHVPVRERNTVLEAMARRAAALGQNERANRLREAKSTST